ncbi:N4-gp56 family major capsid protein [Bacillus sp. FSL K6-3431]|uniref:N4-gp56 family major capsid protein n=1 Tax=Bacillus sp. FSL K6-3431 TaxID=2921500 RepID=UPI0030F5FDED
MNKDKMLRLNIQFFATTKIADLINPEVMGDMVSAELPNMIKFQGVAPIDSTLQGQPGSTITLPKYAYIGDATVVAEGAAIDYTKLETSTAQHTIHKVAKGVELTDEAVLSGYGDPIGEATRQIAMSIASRIDNETLDALKTAPLSVEVESIDPGVIDSIEGVFDDEDESTGVLFVNPKDASKLRAAAGVDWTRASELGDNILIKGAFGEILGWLLIRTKKLEEGEAIAVKAGAAKTYLKRGLNPESARDIDHKLTKFNADQHFVVGLIDDSKVVKVTVAP